MKLKILEQTKDFVAVHKPSGFVTYADSDSQKKISTQFFLEHQLGKKLLPVHRLDKDTCGILLFALNPKAAEALGELFKSREVKKRYLAIVHGHPPAKGEINLPLERNKDKKKEDALTNYRTVKTAELELEGEMRRYALVVCDPETGRFHQIRRHMRALDCPIIGDSEHGNAWDNRVFGELYGVKRTLLSAVGLKLRWNKKNFELKTEPDPDFASVKKKIFP